MGQRYDTVSNPSRLDEGRDIEDAITFVDDQWLADRIGMKIATIRSQRFKRRHGQKHWLELDPVYIGSKPRYRRAEVLEWLRGQDSQIATRLADK